MNESSREDDEVKAQQVEMKRERERESTREARQSKARLENGRRKRCQDIIFACMLLILLSLAHLPVRLALFSHFPIPAAAAAGAACVFHGIILTTPAADRQ